MTASSQTVEVDRLQSDGKQLDGITLYAVTNQSQPPRTLANDKGTFEIVLPAGAELESAQAKGPGGQPIATEATPGSEKNHYLLTYPLRPGETQFQIAFHMPYSGEASFSPKPLRDVQHFVVMTPKSMTFDGQGRATVSVDEGPAVDHHGRHQREARTGPRASASAARESFRRRQQGGQGASAGCRWWSHGWRRIAGRGH